MAVNNGTILAKAWLNGTNDFQQRVPDPTQSSIKQVVDTLFDPMNRMYYNQFCSDLIQRIALVKINNASFENPLKEFKGQKINYGQTVEEVAPAWIKAHSYDDEAESLLKLHRPELKVWFHSQNRRDQYPITVNSAELKSAFDSEFGLNNLINKITMLPRNSDEYDEFQIMKNLFAYYHATWGIPSIHIDAMPTDEKTGKDFLTKVETYARLFKYPSTSFNNQKFKNIPVFALPDEIIIIYAAETVANVNVQTLSSVFQLDKAELPYRIVEVDHIPLPNTAAIMTTRDALVQHDTELTMSSFYNPQRLDTTYFWHHWGIYSISPFVPMLRFTTDEVTALDTITQTVAGLDLTGESDVVNLGDTMRLMPVLKGSVTGSGHDIVVSPEHSVTYGIELIPGTESTNSEYSSLNSRTRITPDNILHIQDSGLNTGDVIKIHAVSTYVNPDGATVEARATYSVGIGQKPKASAETISE